MATYSGLPNVKDWFPANRPSAFVASRDYFLTSFRRWKVEQLDTGGTYEDSTTSKTFMTKWLNHKKLAGKR